MDVAAADEPVDRAEAGGETVRHPLVALGVGDGQRLVGRHHGRTAGDRHAALGVGGRADRRTQPYQLVPEVRGRGRGAGDGLDLGVEELGLHLIADDSGGRGDHVRGTADGCAADLVDEDEFLFDSHGQELHGLLLSSGPRGGRLPRSGRFHPSGRTSGMFRGRRGSGTAERCGGGRADRGGEAPERSPVRLRSRRRPS